MRTKAVIVTVSECVAAAEDKKAALVVDQEILEREKIANAVSEAGFVGSVPPPLASPLAVNSLTVGLRVEKAPSAVPSQGSLLDCQ